jgi:hypothetical protein
MYGYDDIYKIVGDMFHVDVHGSMHHNINLIEVTNKM